MPFQIDVAELSGVVAEAGLYGVYLTLFIVSAYTFARRHRLQVATLNLPMTITAVCMIVLATAQLSVDTANIFVAFLHRTREERIAFLSDTGTKWFSTKHSILIAQWIIGDSFVTYRCWVVWGRRIWVIIIPVLCTLGSAASGTYVTWIFAHHAHTPVKQQKSWVAAIVSFSLCANAVATSLLAFRIWQVNRRTRTIMGTSTSSLMPVVKILLESGAINAAYLLIYNVTLLSGSQSLEIMASVATSISGIIFSIVIIRVGLNAKGELDWTVDHRMTSMNFAAKPKPQPKGGISVISDMENGALSTVHRMEINIQHSFSSGSGTEVETQIETKNS